MLKFVQGRNPDWANQVFFAKYDENAHWIDDLEPAFCDRWWWQDELEEMQQQGWTGDWSEDSQVAKSVSEFGHVAFGA